jgi:hypothetical protein
MPKKSPEKDGDMYVWIRGEIAQKLRRHKAETGLNFTVATEQALTLFFERIDRLRQEPYRGLYTTANMPKGDEQ